MKSGDGNDDLLCVVLTAIIATLLLTHHFVKKGVSAKLSGLKPSEVPKFAEPVHTGRVKERSALRSCAASDCGTLLTSDSDYCLRHQCIRCYGRATTGRYCANHSCLVPGCQAARPSNSKFCMMHKCMRCPNQATSGKFCNFHSPVDPEVRSHWNIRQLPDSFGVRCARCQKPAGVGGCVCLGHAPSMSGSEAPKAVKTLDSGCSEKREGAANCDGEVSADDSSSPNPFMRCNIESEKADAMTLRPADVEAETQAQRIKDLAAICTLPSKEVRPPATRRAEVRAAHGPLQQPSKVQSKATIETAWPPLICRTAGCSATRPLGSQHCTHHQCMMCQEEATNGPCCAAHHALLEKDYFNVTSIKSADEFWDFSLRLEPSALELEAAKSVLAEAHRALAPVFPTGSFCKSGSLAKGTGLRGAMDVDLVIQIPGFILDAMQDGYQRIARIALAAADFKIFSGLSDHVLKTTKSGYSVDVVFTSVKINRKQWWTWAASVPLMLSWFRTICCECPRFPILCRALKGWRKRAISRCQSADFRFPPSYAMEVVAAEACTELSWYCEGIGRSNLHVYFAEALRSLRWHLSEGDLKDPVNDANNMLHPVSFAARTWLLKEIDETLELEYFRNTDKFF